MADPQPQPEIRARSIGALPHRDLDRLDVDELEALYAMLERAGDALEAGRHRLGRIDRAALERAIDAALVTIYRRIGFRRRADRAVPATRRLGAGSAARDARRRAALPSRPDDGRPRGTLCQSPVCPGPHDVDGRHPAGWSV
jgi:hypothetical protein